MTIQWAYFYKAVINGNYMLAKALGISAIITGLFGMMTVGFFFGPIAILLSAIAAVLAFRQPKETPKILSIVGFTCGLLAFVTSPLL